MWTWIRCCALAIILASTSSPSLAAQPDQERLQQIPPAFNLENKNEEFGEVAAEPVGAEVGEASEAEGEGGEFGGEEGSEFGEEGGEEGEEGEEEEEEHFTSEDVAVSAMLLGSVSFVMGLLYLVNYDDDDIRRYTWIVISTTISIFLAVLLFQGFNQVLLMLLKGRSEKTIALVQFIHCLVYIVVMQITIAIIAGAIGESGVVNLDEEVWVINDALRKDNGIVVDQSQVRNPSGRRSVTIDQYGMEVPVMKTKDQLETRVRRMKCYARLLAHMAGFAAINAGGTMQQLEIFKTGPLMELIPVLVVSVFTMAVFLIFGRFRASQLEAAARAGRAGRRAKLYNEEVFEAENDIMALSVSFLLVQVARFAVSGVLPNEEGLEEPEEPHTNKSIIFMYGIGAVFAVLAIALVTVKAKQRPGGPEEEGEETMGMRLVNIGLNVAAMSFAWCMLWSTRWLLFRQPMVGLPSIMGRVVMALCLSAASCLAVFALDTVDDAHKGTEDSKSGAQAIQIIVTSLSILIGFSWEHAFDGGVAAVASKSDHPETVKLVLGLVIAALMTRMWRKHILTKEMSLQKLKEDREEAARLKQVPMQPMHPYPMPMQPVGYGGYNVVNQNVR